MREDGNELMLYNDGTRTGLLFLVTVNLLHEKPAKEWECGMWKSGNQETGFGWVNLEHWNSGTSGLMSHSMLTFAPFATFA